MDFRLVFSFLCVLASQASCRAIGDKGEKKAVIDTIQLIQEEIEDVLDLLSETTLLPNTSCLSFNLTQLMEDEQQNSIYQYLSTFRCFLRELSKKIPKLSSYFHTISDYTVYVEQKYHTPKDQNCSLPFLEQDLDRHVFAKCLLQLLEKRNSEVLTSLT